MGRKKKIGTSGRFGARYGSSLRKRLTKIEVDMKKAYECSSCGSVRVKRVSVGLWRCRKCGFTFAGGAYVPQTKIGGMAERGRSIPTPMKAEPGKVESD